jgi:hypothetical protein
MPDRTPRATEPASGTKISGAQSIPDRTPRATEPAAETNISGARAAT